MTWLQNRTANVLLASGVLVGLLSLGGCATEQYVNEQIATVNTRIDGVEAKANDGIQRADAANAAAQAAAADARNANQRIDQLTGRVDALERQPLRRPRG
jgi:outer membrane murein-binding lipoprotein Lpp